MKHLPVLALACGLGAIAAGCREDRSELRAWRASDHDLPAPARETGEPPAVGEEVSRTEESLASPHRNDGSDAATAMHLWARRCTPCHGQIGAGDGPQSEGMGVADLSESVWQGKTSDEAIARAIQQGKGKMPGFALPSPVSAELVGLIRRMASNPARPSDSVTTTGRPPEERD